MFAAVSHFHGTPLLKGKEILQNIKCQKIVSKISEIDVIVVRRKTVPRAQHHLSFMHTLRQLHFDTVYYGAPRGSTLILTRICRRSKSHWNTNRQIKLPFLSEWICVAHRIHFRTLIRECGLSWMGKWISVLQATVPLLIYWLLIWLRCTLNWCYKKSMT